jgi:hypothetical protein
MIRIPIRRRDGGGWYGVSIQRALKHCEYVYRGFSFCGVRVSFSGWLRPRKGAA